MSPLVTPQLQIQTITRAVRQLLGALPWPDPLLLALPELGTALGCDRLRVWQVHQPLPSQDLWLSPYADWSRDDKRIPSPAQITPLPSFNYWLSRLSAGHSLQTWVGEFPGVEQQWLQSLGITSVLALPITVEENLWGIFTVEYTQAMYHWPEEEIVAIQTFTEPLGGVLGLRRSSCPINASEKQLQEQDEILVQLSRRKSLHQGDLYQALQEIVATAATTLGVSRTSVWLYTKDRIKIRCVTLYERLDDRYSSGQELAAADYPDYFRGLEQERVIAAHDAVTDQRTHEFAQGYLIPLGITAMLDAPIWAEGVMIGVVCHEHIASPRRWTVAEQQFAASIADLVSLAIEASDRHRALADLQASEERLKSFFQATSEAVVIHDQGRIIDINTAAEDLFGYTPQEMIGQSVLMVTDPASRELIISRIQQPSDQPVEAVGQRKDGSTFIGEIQGKSIFFQGRPARVVGIRDITQRKQAETDLRLAAQREQLLAEIALRIRRSLELQDILNTTVVEVRHCLHADRVFIAYLAPHPCRVKIVAAASHQTWETDLEQLLNQPVYLESLLEIATLDNQSIPKIQDFNRGELNPELAAIYQEHQIQSSLVIPIPQDHCGDQVVLVIQQCTVLRFWQPFELQLLEQLANHVAIALQQAALYQKLAALNANLEYQVEERTGQLRQKMSELEELNRLKDVFLHAVSHDLRTPVLGTLMVLNNLMPDILDKNEKTDISVPVRVLKRMIQSHERQLTLIESLLDIHFDDEQTMDLDITPLDFREFLEGILIDLQPLLDKNQAYLNNHIPEILPPVLADASQLRRVFENLITNALKHNRPGLTLTFTAQTEGQCLLCTVADDGVGILPEQLEHLFDLYYRGKQSRQRSGIGLGLYLCRQIIQAHQGKIGVMSQPGEGATFWMTLPVVFQESPRETES